MKSAAKKKVLWGVIIGVVAAALAATGIALAANGVFSGKAEPENTKLYWNVEKDDYLASKATNFETTRGKRKDGYFHVKMASDGEVFDVLAEDKAIVNRIDNERLMGLELDENGIVRDVIILDKMPGRLREQTAYVEKTEGDKITVNLSGVFQSARKEYDMTGIPVYHGNTDSNDPMVGTACKVQADDTIRLVLNKNDELICAYTSPYKEPGDVYWNVKRMYDSTTKLSTRETDLTGAYVFELAVNGEIVTLKTRDANVVKQMDGNGARCFGLTFDEDGFITGYRSAASTTGGSTFGSWYHVMDLNGNDITVKRLAASATEYGNEISGVLAPKVKIFNVSGTGDYIGQPTELKVGDQIHGLTDNRGRVCVIFVVSRKDPDMRIAWNVDRKWDSTNKLTTRSKDGDGWYRIKLAIEGKQIIGKTKDKEIVQAIDSFICYGVKMQGDEIIKVMSAASVYGGGTFASYYDVTKLNGKNVTAKRILSGTDEGKIVDGEIAENCQVYNVSPTATMCGEKTTLMTGDRVHCFKDLEGKVCYIFVVSRPVDVPIYWNKTRMYDTTKNVSTRKVSEDGYYHFEMAVNGKLVDVKTKDKELVNKIDANAAKCWGLEVSGGIVKKVIACSATKLGAGGLNGSWVDVTKISGNRITAKKNQAGHVDDGKIFTIDVVPGVTKAYCVNNSYDDHFGEETKVRVGDRIHVLVNKDKQASVIFVVERLFEGEMYWNKTIKYDKTAAVTTRTPDADGYYWFDMSTGGKAVKMKTKNKEVASFIDSCVAHCMVLKTNGNEIIRAVTAKSLKSASGGTNGSWVDVTSIAKDGTITATKVGEDTIYTIPVRSDCKVYNETGAYYRNFGEETTVLVGDRIHVLVDADKKASFIFVVDKRTLDPMTHVPCEHSDKSITWTPWDGDPAKLQDGGHYTLTKDLYLDDPDGIVVSGMTVSIDLNGHTVGGEGRAFWVPSGATSTLNLCDHAGGAKIATKGNTSNVSGHNGGGALLVSGSAGTLRAYGITVTQAAGDDGKFYTVPEGGLIQSSGTLYLYQCTLDGGHANKGGNLFASAAGQITCRETTVKNGVATTGNGGNVLVTGTGSNPKATVTLIDSTVTGGKAAVAGGGVYVGSDTTSQLKVSGKTQVTGNTGSNVFMSGDNNLIVAGDGLNGAKILVTKDGAGTVTTTNKDYSSVIVSETGDKFVYQGGALKIVARAHNAHCVCGGTKPEGHTCSNVQWIELNKSNIGDYLEDGKELNATTGKLAGTKRFKKDGNYYLSGGITLSNVIEIGKGQNITICLNGYTLTGKSGSNAFKNFGGTLNICDCYGDGTVIGSSANNGVMMLYAGSTVNLYSGNLIAKSAGIGNWGGTVYVGVDAKAEYDMVKAPSTFNMYGGTLDATSANIQSSDSYVGRAGNVYLLGGSEFNLYGGTIKGGSVVKGASENAKIVYAGNFLVDGGGSTLNMYGGSIEGGSCDMTGGNIQVQAGGVMNLYGGSVTGGSAEKGGNIYVSGALNLYGGTVTGATKGGNIYLPNGSSVNIPQTLASGASYGISMEKPGIFAREQTVDQKASFTSDDTAHSVYYIGDVLSLTDDVAVHIAHCVCGKLGSVGDHTSCTTVEKWTELTGAAIESKQFSGDAVVADGTWNYLKAGNYYLGDDFTLSSQVYVLPGQEVTICLNGHKLSGAVRLFAVNGTLNICDCVGGGELYDTRTSTVYGAIYTYAGGVVNLYGGKISQAASTDADGHTYGVVLLGNNDKGAAKAAAPGGLNLYGGEIVGTNTKNNGSAITVFHSNCTINMYGGKISGGKSAAAAGGVSVGAGTFNMYGGTIENNQAAKVGANVYVPATGTFTMEGGTIGAATGNTSVAAASGAKVTLKGGTIDGSKTGNLYLESGATVKVGDTIAEGSKFSLKMAAPGVFANDVTSDLSKFFESFDSKYQVYYWNNTLLLSDEDPSTPPAPTHVHCICGKLGSVGDHTSCKDVAWTELTAAAIESKQFSGDAVVADGTWNYLKAGNYYLGDDFTMSSQVYILPGQEVNICLNGHKLSGAVRLFAVNGTLNICDCVGGGELYDTRTSTAFGAIYTYAGGVVNLYGGKISQAASTDANGHTYGVVLLGNNDKGAAKAAAPGGLNLYGGEIIGTNTKNGGSAITVFHSNSTINMYGGTISGGKSAAAAGGVSVGAGTFNMYDGTIENNQAAKVGANVYVPAAGTFTMEGGIIGEAIGNTSVAAASGAKVTLKGGTIDGSSTGDLYLESGATVKVGDTMADGSKFTVKMATPGVFANDVTSDLSKFFASKDTNYTVEYAEGKLSLVEKTVPPVHAKHCVCGKLGSVGDHTTCTDVEWTELTEKTLMDTTEAATSGAAALKFEEDGCYYLTEDFDLGTTALVIDCGQNISICLNGHQLKGTCRVLRINGTLNLCDCVGGGSVYDARTSSSTTTVYTYSGGTLNMFGGKIYRAAPTTAPSYGLISLGNNDKGRDTVGGKAGGMNMYGGEVVGYKAKQGSAITLFHTSATLNLYGGTVTGGEATTYGGAILLTNGNVNLIGGTVKNGTCNGKADGIYVKTVSNASANMTVADTFKAADPIVVEMGVNGVFATGLTKDMSSCFTAKNSLYKVKYESGKLSLSGHEHCVCVDTCKELKDHTCKTIAAADWTALTSANIADYFEAAKADTTGSKRFKANGSYYLTEDITLANIIEVGGDQEITLCLNGHTLTSKSGARAMLVYGKVNITDCSEDGSGKIIGRAQNYSAMMLYSGATVNQYGGTIESGYTGTNANTVSGGLIYMGQDANAAYDTAVAHKNDGTHTTFYNLYGGAIDGSKCNVQKNGGTIWVLHGATLNVAGGEIKGGKANASADGKTGYNGGNIMVDGKDSTLNISGGTISGGFASGKGGNIYATGIVNISGGSVLDGNSTRSGGNIAVENTGKVIMTGGTVSGGSSENTDSDGGNFYINVGCSLTMSGGEILNGTAKQGSGGNVACYDTFTMSGGKIADGKAGSSTTKKAGGNVSLYQGTAGKQATFTMTGGTIENGYSANLGSNVRVSRNSQLNLEGGTIGAATGNSSVVIEATALGMTLKGGVISGSKTGDLYLQSGKTITIPGTLAEGTMVGLKMAAPGTFASGLTEDLSAFFTSTDTTCKVAYAGGALSLVSAS